MSDEMQAMDGSGDGHEPICPWCSAALPDPEATRCPSCGAALREAAPADVPGVTQVDVEAVLKRRPVAQRSRGLIGWLSGEYQSEAPGTLAPPADEVRREMLRLELAALEAEVHAQQAEAAALASALAVAASGGGPDETSHAADAESGDARGGMTEGPANEEPPGG
jgi:hypothetical protein